MDDFSISKFASVEAKERDRLYRDWILPELPLSQVHKDYIHNKFELEDHSNVFSHRGNIKVKLSSDAPLKDLEKLPCCVINDGHVTLAGPKDGGLLIGVQNPEGQFTGFNIISNRNIQEETILNEKLKVDWWRANGVPRPIMPNGELPIHMVKTDNEREVVLCRGPLAGNVIAEKWGMSAISTIENDFSRKLLLQYLENLEPRMVYILTGLNDNSSQKGRYWQIGRLLEKFGYEYRFLTPDLSDSPIPERFDLCGQLLQDGYYHSLPRKLRREISGDRNIKSSIQDHLKKINARRRMEATTRIRLCIEELQKEDTKISIAGLARKAGVGQKTIKNWMKNNGFADTQTLDHAIKNGGIDISDPVLPLDEEEPDSFAFVPSLFDNEYFNDFKPSENIEDKESEEGNEVISEPELSFTPPIKKNQETQKLKPILPDELQERLNAETEKLVLSDTGSVVSNETDSVEQKTEHKKEKQTEEKQTKKKQSSESKKRMANQTIEVKVLDAQNMKSRFGLKILIALVLICSIGLITWIFFFRDSDSNAKIELDDSIVRKHIEKE